MEKIDKRCGTCAHFDPMRNPETGRALPTQSGGCGYAPTWPVLSAASKYNGANKILLDTKFPVGRADGMECAVWESKKPTKKQQELI